MKRILKKLMYATLVPLCAFAVSCTEDDNWTPGASDDPNCYGVYFPEQENTGFMEIEPSSNRSFTYKAMRTNADDAITVPVTVNSNVENAFAVSPIEFAEGEQETTFTVTLCDDAELSFKYTCSIDITDQKYVASYTPGGSASITFSVMLAKWTSLGMIDFTEDMVAAWWLQNNPIPTYQVELQVNEDSVKDMDALKKALEDPAADESDLAGLYRLVNPYNNSKYAAYGFECSEGDYNVVINCLDINKVYIDLQEVGISVNGGMISIYSLAALYLDDGKAVNDEDYGTLKNGKITFPVKGLLGCPGSTYVGENDYFANTNGLFCVNVAPARNKYELVMPDPDKSTDGDFTFEEVALADDVNFYSTAFTQYWKQPLEKGTVSVTTDDVDKIFAETYGTLYRLPDCYTDGYPIYFCVNANGKIVVPTEYAEQKTGVSQLGSKLAVVIDAANSKFDAATNEVVLSCEFVSEDGKLTFGTFSEVLSATMPEFEINANLDLARDFNYSTQFNDAFKSGIVGESWKTDFQTGTALDASKGALFEAAYGKAYCLPNLYAPNYNIYFCGKDGEVSVPADYEVQPTGLEMFGHKIYATVVSGTVSEFGATLKIQFANESGDLILGTYTESIVTYNWIEVGTCTYNSMMFKNPFTGLTLSQAEGTDLYRVENFVRGGKHLEFLWNSSTNKCELNGIIGSGVDYDGNGNEMVLVDAKGFYNDLNGNDYSWSLLEANNFPQPTYDPATLTLTMTVKWVIPSLGLSTQFVVETIVFDAAPVVSTWENVAVGTYTHTADFWLENPPYAEEGLVLQRYGETSKYKIVGLAEGQMDVEFTYNETTGLVKVPQQYTPYTWQQDGKPIYYGDVWAAFSTWGSTKTEEQVYAEFPNSYDATTKTFTFHIYYYNEAGYYFTENEINVETFQITGDAPAAEPASAKANIVKNAVSKSGDIAKKATVSKAGVRKADLNIGKFSTMTDKPVSCRKSSGKGLAAATPAERDMKRNIEKMEL